MAADDLFYFVPEASKPHVVRILPVMHGTYQARKTPNFDHHGKPIVRYLWPVVVRGQEGDGLQMLNVGASVHSKILRYLIENRVPPKLTFWQKVRYKLSRFRPFGWLKYFGFRDDNVDYCSLPVTFLYFLFEWTPLGFVMRNPPPHDDVVNLANGYDLRISKRFLPSSGGYKFPVYDCEWIEESTPAGTPEQVEAWKQQGKEVFAALKEGTSNGDEAHKAGCSGSRSQGQERCSRAG